MLFCFTQSSQPSSCRCTVELCTKQSPWTSLNYHHLNATFLDPSTLPLLSYVQVTAGSSTLTSCPYCGVAPHFVEHLFQCLACPTTGNSRSMEQSRHGGWFSQAWRQLKKERSCGLQQQQQQLTFVNAVMCYKSHKNIGTACFKLCLLHD